MHLIVLAAGRGSRFYSKGIIVPKPLICYEGFPLFWWSTQSALSSKCISKLTFVVLTEHIKNWGIDKKIANFFPHANLISLDEVTGGAAETAYLSIADNALDEPIAFLDCDLAFSFVEQSPINNFLCSGGAACICTFSSSDTSYSYAKINNKGIVTETKEKDRISKSAIAGLYIFRSSTEFKKAYLIYKNNCNYKEYFLSGLLNIMIKSGKIVNNIKICHHISLGTPDDLRNATLKREVQNWE